MGIFLSNGACALRDRLEHPSEDVRIFALLGGAFMTRCQGVDFICYMSPMFTFIEDLSALSNNELITYSVKLARHEDHVGLQIITCLREAEKRMLFIQLNLKSLWEYATLHLGLSNGNAQLKINAMRLARDNPVAQNKIESGELSIFNAAKVNSFLRHEKQAGHLYNSEEKAEVIESVLGLSQSKCERALLERAPEMIPAEKARPLTATKTELKIVIDEETMTVLGRLKELLSNKIPNATYAQLLDYLAREKVEALERKLMGATLAELGTESKKENKEENRETNHERSTSLGGVEFNNLNEPTPSQSDPEPMFTFPGRITQEISNTPTPRIYISVKDKRWVMKRAKAQCERIGEGGRRCTSRWKLSIDHIVPLVCGGKNERSNYRATCRSCNIYLAKLMIGDVMNHYVPSLN